MFWDETRVLLSEWLLSVSKEFSAFIFTDRSFQEKQLCAILMDA